MTTKDAKKPVAIESRGDVLEQLFGSKTRVRLLRLLLEHPERAYFVRELTRRIDAQLNSVRREIINLMEAGIVRETDVPLTDSPINKATKGADTKKRYYQANPDFLFLEELQTIIRKSSLLLHQELLLTLQKLGDIKLIILTGKILGVNVATDILIVGEVAADSIRQAVQAMEADLGRELNYTHMPIEEFKYRQEVNDRFLDSIMASQHIVVYEALN